MAKTIPMRTKRPAFPKQIFVHYEEPGNGEPYLDVDDTPDAGDTEDGTAVAIYDLREVKTMRVTRKLE